MTKRPISFSGYLDRPVFKTTLDGKPKVDDAPVPDLYTLTPSQQLALITIRRSDLCRELVDKLMHSTVRASEEDYRELTKRGLIQRQGSKRIVTFLGKMRADREAKALAKEFGLHFFTVGHDRLHNRISCTCDWSHYYTASRYHVRRVNAEWMAKHLRDVGEIKATVVAGGDGFIDWPASGETKPEYPEIPFQ